MESMRERFVRVATKMLDDREDFALVLAAIGASLFRESGAMKRHPDRVIDVGIREQLLIGVAAGLALEGLRPLVHTYAPFLVERPFEQLKLDLGHQDLGAVLVSVGASYDASAAGRTHQAPEDVALISTLPGWRVVVPGHPDEAEKALVDSLATRDRVYIRLSEETNTAAVTEAVGGLAQIRDGAAGAPTVISVGTTLDAATEAVADLDVRLFYTCSLPFDSGSLQVAAGGSSEIIVVEPYQEGTTATHMADLLSEAPRRVLSVGVSKSEPRRYGPPEEHRHMYGLDPEGIRERVEAFLNRT